MKELDVLLFGKGSKKASNKHSIFDVDLNITHKKQKDFLPDIINAKAQGKLIRWEIGFKNLEKLGDLDQDGVPNFEDCMPFDQRFQDSEMIQKAVDYFGTTEDPHRAGFIAPSGEMIDMSKENLERLYGEPGWAQQTVDRQIAHAEVGRAIGQIPGRSAIKALQREGALRFRKTPHRGMYAETVEKPTSEQAEALVKAVKTEPSPKFLVIETTSPTVKSYPKFKKEEAQMEVERPHPSIIQRFISRAFPIRAKASAQATQESQEGEEQQQ